MKTLLVPTDYSETANNAVSYALHLAKEENAKVLLFHVFHVPLPSHETPVPVADYPAMEKAEKEKMKKLVNRLEKETGGEITIEGKVIPGLVRDEITDYCDKNAIHLVVMGMSGGGPLKEFFAGSNALHVAKHCKSDVLIIPPNAHYKHVKRIALATDLLDIDVDTVSSTLRHYCKLFNAKAEIITVKDAFTVPHEERNLNRERLHSALAEVKHTVFQPYHEDTAAAIENHMRVKPSDWLAIIHRDYGFFRNLFHKSLTKELAFHSEVPVLSINQHKKSKASKNQ